MRISDWSSDVCSSDLFVAYVIAVTGAIAGLLLALLSVVDPVGFAQLHVVSQEAAAPVARVTRSITGSISGVDDNISAYVKAGTQNRRLRNELDDERRKLVRSEERREGKECHSTGKTRRSQ